ncbi:MAG: sortase [Anaerolineales bacterium]
MTSQRATFETRQQSWVIRTMLVAGVLLLSLGLYRGVTAWHLHAPDQEPEALTLLEAGKDGFAPMLFTGARTGSGLERNVMYPSGELLPLIDSNNREELPAAVPEPAGDVPVRLVIPKIGLDAPIVGAGLSMISLSGRRFYQWEAPGYHAVGWHRDTALLGDHGNTVLNGHHNVDGEVFRDLHLLEQGDLIVIFGQDGEHRYRVSERLILKEKYQDPETRLANARWIQSTVGERLTLVTCWPYETNTHRLFIIAEPLGSQVGGGELPLD